MDLTIRIAFLRNHVWHPCVIVVKTRWLKREIVGVVCERGGWLKREIVGEGGGG